MEEENKELAEEQELVDDGKVHFPKLGFVIIGVLAALMVACIVLILVFRK